ncbi:MAG: DUF1698 domain-containing protein [Micromonosporaceae bacterium]|nr:DUF1698 domain-containing protein [Micromonosporaceae bacterium]
MDGSRAADGDLAKRHLVNPVLLRMLGEVSGRRILDAGCGNGYLSRMLARRGASVVGVEPGRSLRWSPAWSCPPSPTGGVPWPPASPRWSPAACSCSA